MQADLSLPCLHISSGTCPSDPVLLIYLFLQLPLVQGILDVTKDRPWLWAVFLVVIVLPIVLIIAYCCMPKHEVIQ